MKGLGVREARERLGKAGFEVGVRFRESSEQDTDTVLAQSVAGGELAREGSKIFLTVGEGPQVARGYPTWSASPTQRRIWRRPVCCSAV